MKAKKLLISLSVFSLSLFVIAYIIIQLVSTMTTDVSFSLAEKQNFKTTFETNGYIFRNELILSATKTGIVNYAVSETEKLGANQLVATVYDNTRDIDTERLLQAINQKIEILEKSYIENSSMSSDITKIDEAIQNHLFSIKQSVSENEINFSFQHIDDLLVQMNKRFLITNNLKSFTEELDSLKKEKAVLTNSLDTPLCTVFSTRSGYFSTLLDGYENLFSTNVIDEMTVDSFHRLIETPGATHPEYAVGKIITDYDWYTLCEFDKKSALNFDIGKKYPLVFLNSSGVELKATLEKKITQTNRDSVILVFLIEDVPQDFDYTRIQSIRVEASEQVGLSIPRSSLRIVNDIPGVYSVEGNAVGFKKVEIIGENDSVYYCKEFKSADAESKKYLARYDRVITKGKDLYVGKILD